MRSSSVGLELEIVEDLEHFEQIVRLQEEVWGAEVVSSLPQMVAACHNGGVVIAAFDRERVVGFCYGFPGFDGENIYLCSHQLAVMPGYQNQAIGFRLKLRQRQWAMDSGYRSIRWTYDPLESRNGFLNLCKLGGYVDTYIRAYYGEMTDELNRGLPTDRFLVQWELSSERVRCAVEDGPLAASRWNALPNLYGWRLRGDLPEPIPHTDSQSPESGFLVPFPQDTQEIKRQDLGLAREWRLTLREQTEWAFAGGYRVVGLLCPEGAVYAYVLEKRPFGQE